MNTRRQLPFIPLCLAFVTVVTGCGPTHTAVKRPNPQRKDRPALERPAAARGIEVHWNEKMPDGAIQRVVDVEAETGKLTARAESGILNRAHGLMYRQGEPKARFAAPIVEADRSKNRVIARGGVTVTSIEPPGITLTANRITWDSERGRITADGRVHMLQIRPGDSLRLAEGWSDHATSDTQFSKITIP